MDLKNAHSASYALADVAQDIHQKAWKFIPKSGIAYFRFQIDVDVDDECEKYFFVHLAISNWGHIWYTIDDNMHISNADLTFHEDDNKTSKHRASSARYYIFHDLMRPAIEEKIESYGKDIKTVYVRSMFPLERIIMP